MSRPRWRGFSQALQSPADLLAKMQHDYARMVEDPGDPFAAFDFFVGAEHIVDWQWPDDASRRRAVRSQEPAKTISHLANGAKHFEATHERHDSVAEVTYEPDFGTSAFGRARFGEMRLGESGRPALVITRTDGVRVDALGLAGHVLAYWENQLEAGIRPPRCRA